MTFDRISIDRSSYQLLQLSLLLLLSSLILLLLLFLSCLSHSLNSRTSHSSLPRQLLLPLHLPLHLYRLLSPLSLLFTSLTPLPSAPLTLSSGPLSATHSLLLLPPTHSHALIRRFVWSLCLTPIHFADSCCLSLTPSFPPSFLASFLTHSPLLETNVAFKRCLHFHLYPI